MRQAHLAQNGGRGRRIGRRHGGAERDRGGPRQPGHQRVRHDGHRSRGQRHRHQHEPGQHLPIVLEVARRCVIGGVEQHRRDEQRQRQVGLERKRRAARHEGKRHAAERQERRIRRADAPRQRREQDGAEQQRDDPFEDEHGGVYLRGRGHRQVSPRLSSSAQADDPVSPAASIYIRVQRLAGFPRARRGPGSGRGTC